MTHKGMLPGVAVDWKLAAASDLRLSNVGNDDIQQAEDIDDGNHEELETWCALSLELCWSLMKAQHRDPSRLYVEGALCSFGGRFIGFRPHEMMLSSPSQVTYM